MAFDIAAAQNLGFATTADEVAKKAKAGADLGQDAFLKLLTTQLTHQDPTKPMDNGDFIAQLAQFSTVEGIGSLGTSFDKFADSMSSGQALDASGLVGHSVAVPSGKGTLEIDKALEGVIDVAASTSQVTVAITDQLGIPVKTLNLGPQSSGATRFSWDGLLDDGTYAVPGLYTVNAKALQNGENTILPTTMSAKVESVVLGNSQSSVKLDLGELGTIDFNKVQQIF